MAFKTPPQVPLTLTQQKALSQINTFKNMFPIIQNPNIPPDKQISLYDYLKQFTTSVFGPQVFQNMIQTFLNTLFDKGSYELEDAIIKSLNKSFESQGIVLSPRESNLTWLNNVVRPPLHVEMAILKPLIVNRIINMMFGPQSNMTDSDLTNRDQSMFGPDALLQQAVCSSSLFSVSNPANITNGDTEYNQVQLKQNLTAGMVQYTISCQDVKIKLPQSITNALNTQITQINIPGSTTNPSVLFNTVATYVGQQTQLINAPQNTNSIKNEFYQNIIDSILNLITTAVGPQIADILGSVGGVIKSYSIKAQTGQNIPYSSVNPTSCQIQAKPNNKKENSFATTLTNIIYSILCSIILSILLKEIKQIISQVMAKMALNKAQQQAAQAQQQANLLNLSSSALVQGIENAQLIKGALNNLNVIFDYSKNV